MDNRTIAPGWLINEREREAMEVVARARLRREAVQAAAADRGRADGLSRLLQAVRRILSPARAQEAQRVPVRVEVRRQ